MRPARDPRKLPAIAPVKMVQELNTWFPTIGPGVAKRLAKSSPTDRQRRYWAAVADHMSVQLDLPLC
jgi:hypothetical protein